MKIKKLEFTNINSLAGNWVIDFESKPFADTSMFCISGPTGSGKTSILDAICLALYGRTPRQGKINQSANEVMTYGTKSCSAKVTFECRGVDYTATWEQHRGGRTDRLQAYEWTCTNLETGESVSRTNQAEIERKTTELIGLDFEQFTRSMMLAQGEFNKFLKCNEKERAAILEKLTGDEFYRQIAISVHKLYTAADNAVTHIQEQMGNFQPLSDEDRKALDENLAKHAEQKTALAKTIETLNAVLTWYEQEHSLQSNLVKAKEAHSKAESEKLAFAPKEQQLARAQEAQEIEPAYGQLSILRKNVQNDEDSLNKQREQLPAKEAALSEALQKKANASASFESEKAAYTKSEPLWNQVLELDAKIQAAQDGVRNTETTHSKNQGEVGKCKQEIATVELAIQNGRTTLQKQNAYREANAKDSDIEGKLSLLKSKNQELKAQQSNLAKANADATKANVELQNFDNTNAKQKAEFSQVSAYLESHKADADLANILPQAKADLAEAQKNQAAERKNLEEANRQTTLHKDTLTRLEKLGKELQGLKDEKEKLIENDLPVVVIELRENLKEGNECPVCGSKEHPSCSEHNHAEHIAEGVNSLGNLADGLRHLNQDISNVQGRMANEQATAEAAATAAKLAQDQASEAKQATENALAAVNEKIAPWNSVATLANAAAILSNLDSLSTTYTNKKTNAESLTSVLNSAEVTRTGLANKAEQAKSEVEKIQNAIDDLSNWLNAELSPWFSNILIESSDALLAELENKNNAWKKNQQDLQETQSKLSTNTTKLETLQKNLAEAQKRVSESQTALSKAQDDLAALLQNRKELFGDKDIKAEQAKARTARDNAEAAFNAANDAAQKLNTEKEKLATAIDNLKKQLESSKPELESLQKSFAALLTTKNFASEAAFVAARLNEAERKALSDQKQKLEQQQIEAETSEKNASDAVNEHAAKRNFDTDEDTAKTTLTAQKAALDACSSEYTELFSQKDADDKARKQYAALQQQLDTATAKRDRWKQMQIWFNGNRLDTGTGDTFVKFIQAITLKNLLKIANTHMSDMFPRYELTTQNDAPLNIMLIDHDNSDAIRPVSNISGGEGFLVSLSLALAISTMASRNVSIDSMFLDEGFGTLDSKILQDTIVALQKVQREKGKMLGVITHVNEVKDELRVHIDVIPQGNGRSVIKMPA